MERLRVLAKQLTASITAAVPEGVAAPPPVDLPGAGGAIEKKRLTAEDQQELIRLLIQYREGVDKLMQDGEPPQTTMWDLILATKNETWVMPKKEVERLLEEAEQDPAFTLPLSMLPGPWQDATTREARVNLVQQVQRAAGQGNDIHLYAEWQRKYGDRGLSSNIVVPIVETSGWGSAATRRLIGRVLVADAEDAERLSRLHVRKEGNFEPILFDGVISTTNNELWRKQRHHLAEAFLPLSSLAEVLPVSLQRAKKCAKRLAELSAGGREVDMSDFLLHEAQAQLQLALLGASEELMERTNEGIRATFAGDERVAKVGHLANSMRQLMEVARHDKTLGLPTDRCPVRGPLSRAVQTSALPPTADYGNMLLILFAGHDTTGHTMTWLLFELSRNPEVQRAVQAEVDGFFRNLNGRDPTYRDLSQLPLMDKCITETLRMWPAVANGTFRRLQFPDTVKGPGGKEVQLPAGVPVNMANWSRHRNPDLWGGDADTFNPYRQFEAREVARVGCPMAASNPSSLRFSPFAHSPRNCLGRNFAQMEMRLIMLYLLRDFSFDLAPAYRRLQGRTLGVAASAEEFRGINRATMGPMDLESSSQHSWGIRPLYALKLLPQPRATATSSQ